MGYCLVLCTLKYKRASPDELRRTEKAKKEHAEEEKEKPETHLINLQVFLQDKAIMKSVDQTELGSTNRLYS